MITQKANPECTEPKALGKGFQKKEKTSKQIKKKKHVVLANSLHLAGKYKKKISWGET